MRLLRRPKFVDDLADAYAWIASDSPASADRLLDEVERLVDLIGDFPELGRERRELRPGVRSFRIPGFRHVLFYRLTVDEILLLRLLHGSRDIGGRDF